MSRRFLRAYLEDLEGNALRGGWVRVLDEAGAAEVDVYAAASGGTALPQPLSTDSDGEVQVWVESFAPLVVEYSDSGSTKTAGGQRAAFPTFTKTMEGGSTFVDLTDVDWAGVAENDRPAWDAAAGKLVPRPPSSDAEVDVVSNVASGRFIARISAGPGPSEELTPAQARTLADVDQAGTAAGLVAAEATARDGAIETHRADTTNVHGITDTSVLETTSGAQAKVDAEATARATAVSGEATARANADALLIPLTQKGAASGVAELDSGGKVPSAQLPSFVDDVVEAANFAALPVTGETGKIYVTIDDGKTYRWSGSAYVEISASLALGETSTTAYRGDRGKTAYDHSQLVSGNPHAVTKSDVGLGNADNTSDAGKPVSTAQQTALDLKAPLASPALTGNPTAPTQAQGNSSTRLATTAYVQTEAGLLIPKSIGTAQGDLIYFTASGTPTVLPKGTGLQFLRMNSGATAPEWATDTDSIEFVIGSIGTALTTGVKGYLEIPFACTINRATLLADQSGSVVVNVWKDTYANYPPVVGDKITASAPPTISTATKSQDSTLTGWTTLITAGDVLAFNVDSVTSIQQVTLSLRVTK